MPDSPKESHIWVNGVVARRNKQPYIQIDINGHMIQMSLAEARSVAQDIQVQCARTEADAMIHQFFERQDFPPQAADAMMIDFRSFRAKLDDELVEKMRTDPDAG